MPEGQPSRTWWPPTESQIEAEWIRLKSGEWLKGEISAMRDDELEFESAELDTQTFDWEDVAQVHSPRPNTYVFDGRDSAKGTAVIRDDVVIVDTGEAVERFPRNTLIAIVPGGEANYWTGKGSVGLTARAGNTNQWELTINGWVRRESLNNRLRLDYNGSLGEIEGETNINTGRLTAKYDIYVTRRIYVTPVSFEYFQDELQNIDYRLTPGVGLGYHLFTRKRIDWDVELGGSYQRTVSISAPEGEDQATNIGVVRFSSYAETEITKRIDFDLRYTLQIGVTDIDDSTHNALAVLSVELTKLLDLDVSFTWDRLQGPRPDENGVFPEQDDFRLSIGLGIER